MTYLQLVNNILVRLRERETQTVNQNAYIKLIAALVNDAKEEVESAWDWSALRTTLTATTSPDIFSYSLTGSQNNMRMLNVLNDTSDRVMRYAEAKWMTEKFLLSSPQKGEPEYYSYNGIDTNGDTIVDIYPIPDGAYTLRFNGTLRQDDLVNDTDQLLIPNQPVLLLAWAKAIEERGEDSGVMSSSAYATAQRSLADAISLDAMKHPEELIWGAV